MRKTCAVLLLGLAFPVYARADEDPVLTPDRHGVVFEFLYPGVAGIGMIGGQFVDWPAAAGTRPTMSEIDALIPDYRKWRARRDAQTGLTKKYEEILHLEALRAKDPDIVPIEKIEAVEAEAAKLKQEWQSLPEPVVTPKPTPAPKE